MLQNSTDFSIAHHSVDQPVSVDLPLCGAAKSSIHSSSGAMTADRVLVDNEAEHATSLRISTTFGWIRRSLVQVSLNTTTSFPKILMSLPKNHLGSSSRSGTRPRNSPSCAFGGRLKHYRRLQTRSTSRLCACDQDQMHKDIIHEACRWTSELCRQDWDRGETREIWKGLEGVQMYDMTGRW